MATEGIYPQITTGSLGSSQGLAERIREMERELDALSHVKTFIGAGTISTGHIAALSITAGQIQANAINSGHIQTGSINAGHMQADSITVTNAALSNLVVTTAKIADAAILTAKIGDAQITTAKIGNLQVQTANIDNLAVTTGKIGDAQITTAKIGDAQITTAKIIDANITTAKIGDAQVTNVKVANLAADKITSGSMSVDRLDFTVAAGDSLLARIVAAGTVVASTGLSAVSANMGTLTSGKIVIGSASAQKTAIGSNISTSAGTKSGIVGTDSSNNITFHLDNTNGNLSLKGQLLTGSTGLGNLDGKVYNTTDPLFVTNPSGGVAIVADSITTRELFVTTLSAITADMGTLTAGRISGGTIDGNVIDAGTITAGKLSVKMGGYNRLANSSFENATNNLDGWTAYNGNFPSAAQFTLNTMDGTGIDSGAQQGTRLAYVQATTTTTAPFGLVKSSDRPAARAGKVYTLSLHAVTSWPAAVSHGGHVHWLDASGSIIGSGFPFSFPTTVNGAFARHQITTTAAPTGTVTAQVYIWVTTSLTTGYAVWYDAVQFEEGDVMTAYAPKSDELLPNSVTESVIAPGSISTGKLTATAIDGMTITGATLRTSASHPKVQVDTSSLIATDAGGAETFSINMATGGVRQGKRAYQATEIIPATGAVGWVDTGVQVVLPVDSDAVVHLYAEADIRSPADPGAIKIGVYEVTDISTPLEFGASSGVTSYVTRRTLPGNLLGSSTALAGEYIIRPSSTGTRTYKLYYHINDANSLGGAGVKNMRMHAYTT